MTDFFADLEAELLGAAARRTAPARPPRRARPSLALAGSVITLVAVAVIALVLLLPTGANRDRGAVSPPALSTATEVAVLNGTTTPGLGSRTFDRLESAGFPRTGKVATWRSQVVRRSRVVHAPGSEATARDVARRLGIGLVRPARASELSLGGAPVVVVLGLDHSMRTKPSQTIETVSGRIAFFNAASNDNRVAAKIADRLQSRLRFNESLVDAAPGRNEPFSRVLYGARGEPLAARVARILGITTVRPATGDPLARKVPSDAGDPIVVLGTDLQLPDKRVVGVEARIEVVDGSGRPALAAGVRNRLIASGYPDVRLQPDPPRPPLPESSVGHGPGAAGVAGRIAALLRIRAIRAATLPDGVDVVVTVGRDLRTR